MDVRLTDKQAKVLIEALDLYSRVGMQQLEAVGTAMQWNFGYDVDIEKEIAGIKVKLGQPVNGSWGIASPKVHDKAKIAYDAECVIRQNIAKRESHPKYSVWHRNPMHIGSEPLLTIIGNGT